MLPSNLSYMSHTRKNEYRRVFTMCNVAQSTKSTKPDTLKEDILSTGTQNLSRNVHIAHAVASSNPSDTTQQLMSHTFKRQISSARKHQVSRRSNRTERTAALRTPSFHPNEISGQHHRCFRSAHVVRGFHIRQVTLNILLTYVAKQMPRQTKQVKTVSTSQTWK